MNVILYTVGCPKCRVLEAKLKEKNISYKENNNKDEMMKLNFVNVPILEVDGARMEFKEAIEWIKEQ